MEIQSAFNTGIQGYQKATEVADRAAFDIVATTSVNLEANSIGYGYANREPKIPDLNQSIVNLKVAEYQAKAAAEVIQTADDNLGTLLDVTA